MSGLTWWSSQRTRLASMVPRRLRSLLESCELPVFISTKTTSLMRCSSIPLKMRKSIGLSMSSEPPRTGLSACQSADTLRHVDKGDGFMGAFAIPPSHRIST